MVDSATRSECFSTLVGVATDHGRLGRFPYQKETVRTMVERECLAGGLNSLLWEEHRPLDLKGRQMEPYWYNRVAGELLEERPVCNTGSFLCEEMGLGKTVEVISLILENRSRASVGESFRQTLIVVPLSILGQWEAEFASKVAPGMLSVYTHHCSRQALNGFRMGPSVKYPGSQRHVFDQADVVLTTYEQLTIETTKAKGVIHFKLLTKIDWYRVVLDESQRIQNRDAVITAGACMLSRKHSWLVSGTPVGHVVEDLLGQLLFLQVGR